MDQFRACLTPAGCAMIAVTVDHACPQDVQLITMSLSSRLVLTSGAVLRELVKGKRFGSTVPMVYRIAQICSKAWGLPELGPSGGTSILSI